MKLLKKLKNVLFRQKLSQYSYHGFMSFVFLGQNKYCSRLPMPAIFFEKIRISVCEQYFLLTKNEDYLLEVKKNIKNAKDLNDLNVERGRVLEVLVGSLGVEEIKYIFEKHWQPNQDAEELLNRINVKIRFIFKTMNGAKGAGGGGDTQDFYSEIVRLSHFLGFRLPVNVNIMEYIAYVNYAQEVARNAEKQQLKM